MSDNTPSIEQLTSLVTNLQNQINQINSGNIAGTNILSMSQKLDNINDLTIPSLRDNINSVQNSQDNLQQSHTNFQNRLDNNKNNLSDLQNQIQDTSANHNTLANNINNLNNQHNDLNNKVLNTSNNNQNLQNYVNNINSSHQNISSEIQNLKYQMQNFNTKLETITPNDSQHSQLMSKIDNLSNTLTPIMVRTQVANQNSNNLYAELQPLSQTVNNQNSQIHANSAGILQNAAQAASNFGAFYGMGDDGDGNTQILLGDSPPGGGGSNTTTPNPAGGDGSSTTPNPAGGDGSSTTPAPGTDPSASVNISFRKNWYQAVKGEWMKPKWGMVLKYSGRTPIPAFAPPGMGFSGTGYSANNDDIAGVTLPQNPDVGQAPGGIMASQIYLPRANYFTSQVFSNNSNGPSIISYLTGPNNISDLSWLGINIDVAAIGGGKATDCLDLTKSGTRELFVYGPASSNPPNWISYCESVNDIYDNSKYNLIPLNPNLNTDWKFGVSGDYPTKKMTLAVQGVRCFNPTYTPGGKPGKDTFWAQGSIEQRKNILSCGYTAYDPFLEERTQAHADSFIYDFDRSSRLSTNYPFAMPKTRFSNGRIPIMVSEKKSFRMPEVGNGHGSNQRYLGQGGRVFPSIKGTDILLQYWQWQGYDFGNWDVSNVTTMRGMFAFSTMYSNDYSYQGLLNWNTTNVKDMAGMFFQCNSWRPFTSRGNYARKGAFKCKSRTFPSTYNAVAGETYEIANTVLQWGPRSEWTEKSVKGGWGDNRSLVTYLDRTFGWWTYPSPGMSPDVGFASTPPGKYGIKRNIRWLNPQIAGQSDGQASNDYKWKCPGSGTKAYTESGYTANTTGVIDLGDIKRCFTPDSGADWNKSGKGFGVQGPGPGFYVMRTFESYDLMINDPNRQQIAIDPNNNCDNTSSCWNNPKNATDIDNWDVSNVTDMSYMFFGTFFCDSPRLNTTDMDNADGTWRKGKSDTEGGKNNFSAPTYWQTIYGGGGMILREWNLNNVKDMSYMFSNSKWFSKGCLNWNTINVTNMEGLFFSNWGFSSTIGDKTFMWDTSNVTNMSKMFSGRGREGRYGRLHNRSRQVNTIAAGLHCADVGPSKGPNFPTGFGQSSGYTFGKPFGSGKDSGKVVIQYKSPGVYQIGLPGGWNKNGKYLQGNGTGPSARSTIGGPTYTDFLAIYLSIRSGDDQGVFQWGGPDDNGNPKFPAENGYATYRNGAPAAVSLNTPTATTSPSEKFLPCTFYQNPNSLGTPGNYEIRRNASPSAKTSLGIDYEPGGGYMPYAVMNLKDVQFKGKWNTYNVRNMDMMFMWATNFNTLHDSNYASLSSGFSTVAANWNVSNVTSAYEMFFQTSIGHNMPYDQIYGSEPVNPRIMKTASDSTNQSDAYSFKNDYNSIDLSNWNFQGTPDLRGFINPFYGALISADPGVTATNQAAESQNQGQIIKTGSTSIYSGSYGWDGKLTTPPTGPDAAGSDLFPYLANINKFNFMAGVGQGGDWKYYVGQFPWDLTGGMSVASKGPISAMYKGIQTNLYGINASPSFTPNMGGEIFIRNMSGGRCPRVRGDPHVLCGMCLLPSSYKQENYLLIGNGPPSPGTPSGTDPGYYLGRDYALSNIPNNNNQGVYFSFSQGIDKSGNTSQLGSQYPLPVIYPGKGYGGDTTTRAKHTIYQDTARWLWPWYTTIGGQMGGMNQANQPRYLLNLRAGTDNKGNSMCPYSAPATLGSVTSDGKVVKPGPYPMYLYGETK